MTRHLTREERVAPFFTAAKKTPFRTGSVVDTSMFNAFEEEGKELLEAAWGYVVFPTEENRLALYKEWADAQYTLSQLALYFDIPADPAFNRVAENNMTKVVDGKIKYREDGKVLKPEGYVPTDMRGL